MKHKAIQTDKCFGVVPLWILLFAVLLTTVNFTEAKAQETAPKVQKEIVDSTLTIDGKTVIVEQSVLKLDNKAGFNRTLSSYAIKDWSGTTLFVRDFPETEVTENGFGDEFHIGPYTISTPGKEALVISHWYYPSAPGTGEDLQFFVWQKGKLVPLSKPFDIYGDYEEISRADAGSDITLSDSETILMLRHLEYYFYSKIPVVINLDPAAAEPYRVALAKDKESGLNIIPLMAERRPSFMDDQPAEVRLYKSAAGETFKSVRVDRESTIEIGPAYGHASARENERGAGVSVQIKRLQVTIDGKIGYVEEKDYQKLGLPAFG